MIEPHNPSISPYVFPRPPAVKAFIKAFLPALLILGAVVFAVIRYGDQRAEVAILEALQEEERQAAASMSRIVQQALLNTTASLEYLVLLIERQLAESAPVEDVAQVLLDFSKTHPVFDQLRYLDMEGQEVVRVDAEVDGYSARGSTGQVFPGLLSARPKAGTRQGDHFTC